MLLATSYTQAGMCNLKRVLKEMAGINPLPFNGVITPSPVGIREIRLDYIGQKTAKSEPEKIGHLIYTVEDNDLFINDSNVKKLFRQKGIANELYYRAIKDNPHIKSITCGFAETNNNAFHAKFVELLQNEPGYITPSKKLDPIKQFEECCTHLITDIQKRKYDHFVEEAIKATPAFKITKKHGFKKICPGSIDEYKLYGDGIFFNFSVCR